MADQVYPVERVDYAADLIAALMAGKLEMRCPAHIEKYIAMRESDREKLPGYANWDPNNTGRPYKVDPLSEKISIAFADFLWGEDPTIEPADERDVDLLEEIISANDLSDELHWAEQIKSSEGEVWWRIYRDDEQFPYPIIEWHSRTEVIPYYRGKRLLAVAFVDTLYDHYLESDAGNSPSYARDSERKREICRWLQVYGPEVVYNKLFVSSDPDKIGDERELTTNPDTENIAPEWRHGLPMLAGRVINRRGRKRSLGRSDYHGVEDLLFDLNEAHTIDSENFRLAGKKRAVMPQKYAKEDGSVDPGEEIFYSESLDELDPDNTFKILEYSYEGESSKARKDDLTGTILTRVGLARQFVDPNATEGLAGASGTALRVRLIPTTLTARGKSRAWDEELPTVLTLAQQVDALPETQNGFGRSWAASGEAPSIERGSILPEDRQEELDYHVAAVGANIESEWTAIQSLHPDWPDELVQQELDRIQQENQAVGGFFGDPNSIDGSPNGGVGEVPIGETG